MNEYENLSIDEAAILEQAQKIHEKMRHDRAQAQIDKRHLELAAKEAQEKRLSRRLQKKYLEKRIPDEIANEVFSHACSLANPDIYSDSYNDMSEEEIIENYYESIAETANRLFLAGIEVGENQEKTDDQAM